MVTLSVHAARRRRCLARQLQGLLESGQQYLGRQNMEREGYLMWLLIKVY